MNLPKTVPQKWVTESKPGDTIACQGHTAYAHTPLVKAGIPHATNKAWLILLSGQDPVAVTVITRKEQP